MSQPQLAERIGASAALVRSWEQGRTTVNRAGEELLIVPSARVLPALERALALGEHADGDPPVPLHVLGAFGPSGGDGELRGFVCDEQDRPVVLVRGRDFAAWVAAALTALGQLGEVEPVPAWPSAVGDLAARSEAGDTILIDAGDPQAGADRVGALVAAWQDPAKVRTLTLMEAVQ